jgi:hypothetical protein
MRMSLWIMMVGMCGALTHCSGARPATTGTNSPATGQGGSPSTALPALPGLLHADGASPDATQLRSQDAGAPSGLADGAAVAAQGEDEPTEEGECRPRPPPPDTTDAELAAAAARPDAPDAVSGDMESEDDGSRMDAWILTRVRRARAGQPERVRILLTARSNSWGCRCPTNFIGGDPDQQGPGQQNWLTVDWLGGVREPTNRENDDGILQGWQVWVEGRFTGVRSEEDLRDDCGQPDGYFYRPWAFEVLARYRRRVSGDEIGRVLR